MPPTPISETVQQFYDIVQDRLGNATREGKHEKAWSSDCSTSKDYETELNLLKPHLKPFFWGVGTTVALFATFRISKNTGSLRKAAKGYQFDNLQKNKTRKDKLSDATSIPADIFLSMIVGVSSALFLSDEEKIKDDLAQMPLIQGRSLVSEELCTDFIKEYEKVLPQLWTSNEAKENTSMQAIRCFVTNCQKRQILVDYRNEHLNLLDCKDAENIPSPGVLEHLSRIQVPSKEQE